MPCAYYSSVVGFQQLASCERLSCGTAPAAEHCAWWGGAAARAARRRGRAAARTDRTLARGGAVLARQVSADLVATQNKYFST